ncbi:MAG: hypothetical protein M3443_14530 [Actinomycetota bacterium]|nr:hypothetical protein [Actinomycetota bacterium]
MAVTRMKGRTVIVALAATAVAGVVLVPWGARALADAPAITGVDDGATVSAEAMRELAVSMPEQDLAAVEVLIDGRRVDVRRDGDRLVLAEPALSDGEHTITARMPANLLPDSEVSRTFTVDGTAPTLSVDLAPVTEPRKPYTVQGKADGGTSVTVEDQTVAVDGTGSFALTLPVAPTTIQLTTTDAVGNRTTRELPVPIRHPGMRAVHMSAMAWSSAELREPVLRMAAEGRINAVQLDIKDESGEIGYESQVPLAREVGATRDHYDAKAVIEQLHARGIRVVGRLVAFRDPILARSSWESGAKDMVIQTQEGTPWAGTYGQYAFTNFANPDVIDYNVALATEAAKLGFDDILYDYIRRPEGALAKMRIPGLVGTAEQSIVNFLAKSHESVRDHGAFQGASVFGIAASRPTAVSQDIPAMARHSDYIAPMVYPSHWGPGEYGVASPHAQPYDITARSVAAFAEQVKGTNSQVIPWLQAFSLGRTYGPAEVRAQITASEHSGSPSFLLWNASCRYGTAGL